MKNREDMQTGRDEAHRQQTKLSKKLSDKMENQDKDFKFKHKKVLENKKSISGGDTNEGKER